MWAIEIRNHLGSMKAFIQSHGGFEFSRKLSGVGWFNLALPYETKTVYGQLLANSVAQDDLVIFYNLESAGNVSNVDSFFFLEKWEIGTNEDGSDFFNLSGSDQNGLVKRRIVAYKSGSPNATQNDFEGNIMEHVVYTNFSDGATNTSRILPEPFSMPYSYESLGTQTSMSFAWQKVETVLQKISESSLENGSEVFWDFRVVGFKESGVPQIEFVVMEGYPGGDQTKATAQNGSPTVFSTKVGNLKTPSLVWDYSQEANSIVVGGPGEGSKRRVQRTTNQTAVERSQWNFKESFLDARNEVGGAAGLIRAGKQELSRKRPKIYFSGRIVSNPVTPYGKWRLGSLVTVSYKDFVFDALVRTINVRVSADGEESVFSNIEIESEI